MASILEMNPNSTLEQMREQLATFVNDPYPVYRQMRDQTPTELVFLPPGIVPGLDQPLKAWALMKYAESTMLCATTSRSLRHAIPSSNEGSSRASSSSPTILLATLASAGL
jgi:hypothetical protein